MQPHLVPAIAILSLYGYGTLPLVSYVGVQPFAFPFFDSSLLIASTIPTFAAFLLHLCGPLCSRHNLHDRPRTMAPYLLNALLLQARATGAHSDENSAPPYSAFLIVMTVVVIIAIIVRFWSRALAASEKKLTQRYWWDDWLALAAVVSSAQSQPCLE